MNSVFHPFRFERQILGVIKPFHFITHSPSCKHLTSPFSFQHPVFQHQLTRIPGSPRTVTRLPPPFHPDWNLFGYILLISSILYGTHPHHSISSYSQYFSRSSSVVSSFGHLQLFASPAFYYSPPPPFVQTSPSPYFIIKTL